MKLPEAIEERIKSLTFESDIPNEDHLNPDDVRELIAEALDVERRHILTRGRLDWRGAEYIRERIGRERRG